MFTGCMGQTDVKTYRNVLKAIVKVSADYKKPRVDYWPTLQGVRESITEKTFQIEPFYLKRWHF